MYPHRINLAGPWQFVSGNKTFRVKFPFQPQQYPELQELGYRITVRRIFRWPTSLLPFERLWLTINSDDMPLQIHLNRQLLGEHQAPFLPWSQDISDFVQQQNLLEITFSSPAPAISSQRLCGPSYLEVRRQVHLSNICGKSQWENNRPRLEITAHTRGKSDRTLALVVRLNNQEVVYQEFPELTRTTDQLNVVTPLLDVPLWQPGRANQLQALELHLLDPACLLDQHSYQIGFRRVEHQQGDTYQVNGQLLKQIEIHDLSESITESLLLDRYDQEGSSIVLFIPADDILEQAYAPFLWPHPCIIDYSFASNSIASRKP